MTSTAPGADEPAVRVEVVCLSHSPGMAADSAGLEGQVFRKALAEIAAAVQAYDPTELVIFGADHRRALGAIAPAITVVEGARGFGDWGLSEDTYPIDADRAGVLVEHLLDADFDVAVGHDVRLDHGFGLTLAQLFGSPSQLPSALPVVLNCLDAPMASMRRVVGVGRIVGEALRGTLARPGARVLALASGGLSHTPPLAKPGTPRRDPAVIARLMDEAADLVDPGWDAAMMELCSACDTAALAAMSTADLERGGTGAHELRTWAAALATGGVPLVQVGYENVRPWATGMGAMASPGLLSHSITDTTTVKAGV